MKSPIVRTGSALAVALALVGAGTLSGLRTPVSKQVGAAPAIAPPDYSAGIPSTRTAIDPRLGIDTFGDGRPFPPRTQAPSSSGRVRISTPLRAHDTMASAVPIPRHLPAGFTDRTSLAGSTRESGEPTTCSSGGGTLWYSFEPSGDTVIRADTIGSDAQVRLGVFVRDAIGGSLRMIDCRDEFGYLRSQAESVFQARAGRAYLLQLAWSGRGPSGVAFNVEILPPAADNDDWDDAKPIDAIPFRHEFTPIGLTLQDGEIDRCEFEGTSAETQFDRTAWYRMRTGSEPPPMRIVAAADGLAISPEALLTVYRGGEREWVACSFGEDHQEGAGYALTDPQPDTTYWIQVGYAKNSTPRPIRFTVSEILPPRNDRLTDVTVVGSLPFREAVYTFRASLDPDEPQSCGPLDASIWYRIRPDRDTALHVDTVGSSVDTILAVYEGGPKTQRLVTCNDDMSSGQITANPESHLAFRARAETDYFVQVAGRNYALSSSKDLVYRLSRGRIVTTIREADPPINDSRFAAIDLRPFGGPYLTATSSSEATIDPDEPAAPCGPIGASLWYRVRASHSGVLVAAAAPNSLWHRSDWWSAQAGRTLHTNKDWGTGHRLPNKQPQSVGFPLTVAVWEKPNAGPLRLVTCDDDREASGPATAAFPAVAGSTYFVQIGGIADRTDYRSIPIQYTFGSDRGSICVRVSTFAEWDPQLCGRIL